MNSRDWCVFDPVNGRILAAFGTPDEAHEYRAELPHPQLAAVDHFGSIEAAPTGGPSGHKAAKAHAAGVPERDQGGAQ